jgi:hypothetical protein
LQSRRDKISSPRHETNEPTALAAGFTASNAADPAVWYPPAAAIVDRKRQQESCETKHEISGTAKVIFLTAHGGPGISHFFKFIFFINQIQR